MFLHLVLWEADTAILKLFFNTFGPAFCKYYLSEYFYIPYKAELKLLLRKQVYFLFCRLIIEEMCRLHNAIPAEYQSDRIHWKQYCLRMHDLVPVGFANDPEKQKRYGDIPLNSNDDLGEQQSLKHSLILIIHVYCRIL